MNIIDLAVVAVIGLSIAFGLYSGLISSLLNLVGFFVSWFFAVTMHRRLSGWIVNNTSLLGQIVHYTEGASRIGSLETANTAVAGVGESFAREAVTASGFPKPFDGMLIENILQQVFSGEGLSTMADYFNYTLAYAALNIISFLLILGVFYLLFSVLNNIVGYVMQFPVLSQCDSLLGGAFGLVRGVLLVFAVFMLLPIVLAVLPMEQIEALVQQSRLAPFFTDFNVFLRAIQSVL